MKKELEEKLVKKYPTVFGEYGGDMRETCMAWGLTCGDGWYKIIDELCQVLEPAGVVAAQVKEKFGGLRFYVNPVKKEKADEVFEAIQKAEAASYITCENCGEPGERRSGGWIRVLCDKCEEAEVARLK